MLKATAGGGGKGMRIAKDAKELSSAWELLVRNQNWLLTMMTCI